MYFFKIKQEMQQFRARPFISRDENEDMKVGFELKKASKGLEIDRKNTIEAWPTKPF